MKGQGILFLTRFLIVNVFLLFQSVTTLKAETLTLNSQPIGELIDFISTESGIDIILSDEVVQVPLTGVFTYDDSLQLLSAFYDLLEINNLSFTFSEDRLLIIPSSDFVEPLPNSIHQSFELKFNSPTEFINNNVGIFSAVEAVPVGNSIFITGIESDVSKVLSMIGLADVPARQLLIEVTIIEVLKSNTEDFDFKLQHAFENSGFTFINNGGSRLSDIGASLTYLSGGSLTSFVNLISTFDDVNIVSASKLLVQDSHEAYITVGENVPFLSSVETIEDGTRINNIVRKDVGLSLSILPTIMGEGVRLQINQELSSVSPSTVASDIITNQRSIDTGVTVSTGRSILIGGLVSSNTQNSISEPLLISKIPLVGKLFRGKSNSSINRDMRLMIKATIIND